MNEWNILLIILFSSSQNISLLIFWVLIVITLIRIKSNWKWCCWKCLINVYFIRGLWCLYALPSRALVMNHLSCAGLLSVTPIPCYFFNAFLNGDNYGDDPGFRFRPGPWKDVFIPFEARMGMRKGFGYVLLSWCPCHSAESCRWISPSLDASKNIVSIKDGEPPPPCIIPSI